MESRIDHVAAIGDAKARAQPQGCHDQVGVHRELQGLAPSRRRICGYGQGVSHEKARRVPAGAILDHGQRQVAPRAVGGNAPAIGHRELIDVQLEHLVDHGAAELEKDDVGDRTIGAGNRRLPADVPHAGHDPLTLRQRHLFAGYRQDALDHRTGSEGLCPRRRPSQTQHDQGRSPDPHAGTPRCRNSTVRAGSRAGCCAQRRSHSRSFRTNTVE